MLILRYQNAFVLTKRGCMRSLFVDILVFLGNPCHYVYCSGLLFKTDN